jgi:hypothetical protein
MGTAEEKVTPIVGLLIELTGAVRRHLYAQNPWVMMLGIAALSHDDQILRVARRVLAIATPVPDKGGAAAATKKEPAAQCKGA